MDMSESNWPWRTTTTTTTTTTRSSSNSDTETNAQPSPDTFTNNSSSTPAPLRRRPIPSKGHTKSRKGCLTCKRRRVKCPENQPECDTCVRLGLHCQWPQSKDAIASSTVARPSAGLTVKPLAFTMDDLRFFQHFLLTAYPSLPIDGEAIWKEIACLSHNFDYLIHAMLGLAASHLHLATLPSTDYTPQALSHRVQSITSLNRSLNSPCTSKAEGDARFATLMALTFQSSYMADGMLDFMAMVRGCVLIPTTAMTSFSESAFREFTTEEHSQRVVEMSAKMMGDYGSGWYSEVPWYRDFCDEGLASVKALASLCQSSFELVQYGVLVSILENARISPVQGFLQVTNAYKAIETVSNEDFKHFIDPTNTVSNIILAHFFLIEHEIAALAMQPNVQAWSFRSDITASWVKSVARDVPPEYASYLEWPLAYAAGGKMRKLGQPPSKMVIPGLVA